MLGDSISDDSITEWPGLVQANYTGPWIYLQNHATAGDGVVANSGMDIQTTAAAGDDDDIIIIALGVNDDNAGNMTTLQATYETDVAALKSSNPRATIYGMNVLPVWTDNTGTTEVDKSNIRTAIAAACTSQGITCWDTYTTPWIDAADTSDGKHLLAAGSNKVATEVLARL